MLKRNKFLILLTVLNLGLSVSAPVVVSADQTTNDFQQGRFNKKDEEESTISLHDLLIKAN